MNWGELAGWVVLALMVIAASRRYDNRLTVEQEQAKARELASHAPQWNGVPTMAPETHDYSAWDLHDCTPESVSHFMQERGKPV